VSRDGGRKQNEDLLWAIILKEALVKLQGPYTEEEAEEEEEEEEGGGGGGGGEG
jgi:hypothetical protein